MSPEIAEQGAPFGTRLRASFAASEEHKLAFLRQQYGSENVGTVQEGPDQGRIVVREGPDQTPFFFDEKGFGLGDLADMAGGAPEVLGSMLGGAGATLATGGNPLAGVIGAGAGAAGGEAVRQVGAKLAGIPPMEAGEESLGARLAETGKAATRGAVGETVGLGMNKVYRPLGPRTPVPTKELVREAEEANLPLSPSDISKGRTAALGETVLSNMFGSAGLYQKFRLGQLRRIGELRDGLLSAFGGQIEGQAAGERAGQGLDLMTETFRKTARTMFDKAEHLSGSSTIKLPELTRALDGALNNKVLQKAQPEIYAKIASIKSLLVKKAKPGPELYDAAGNLVPTGTPAGPAKLTFAEARELRSALGKLSRSQEVIAAKREGLFKHVFGKLEDDLDSWAGSAEGAPAMEAYRAAADYYRPRVQAFNSPVGKRIKRLVEQGPEKIVPSIFRPGNITEIETTRKIVGPSAFKDLSRRWLDQELEKANIQIVGKDNIAFDTVSIAKLKSAVSKMETDGTLSKMFLPEEVGRLKRFIKLGESAGTAQRIAGNPSGTGQVLANAGTVKQLIHSAVAMAGRGAQALSAPVTAGATIAVPWGLAHWILSPATRKVGTVAGRAAVGAAGAGAVTGTYQSLK